MTTHAPHTPPHETSRAAGRSGWQERKACTAEDFDLFLSDEPAVQEIAKQICVGCPVREQCLQFALDTKAGFGVFGGKTADERSSMPGASSAANPVGDFVSAIVEYRRKGLSWEDIGSKLGFPAGTTWKRVERWARSEVKAGRSVPEELRERRRAGLPKSQVLDIRRRAKNGESDTEQSLRTGLSKSSIARIVTGARYGQFGGPLREKRVGCASRPTLASCTQFNKGRASYYPKELAS